MLQENLGLRILSLVIAIFVWMQYLLVSEQNSVINLPVTLRSIPENITLANFPKSIPFQVRGRGLDIIKLKLSRTNVFIDAGNIKPGTDIISLSNYTIDLPQNIQLELLGPADTDKLAIHADEFHQKKVPVFLSFTNDYTREHFYSLNYSIIPEQITIFGPKSKVQLVDKVTTETITNNMLEQSEFNVKLNPLPNDVSTSETQIKIKLSASFNTTKIIDNLPVTVSEGKKCIPSSVTIKLSGNSDVLNSLDIKEIKTGIDEHPDAQGFYSVRVEVPNSVKLIDITPKRVRLK